METHEVGWLPLVGSHPSAIRLQHPEPLAALRDGQVPAIVVRQALLASEAAAIVARLHPRWEGPRRGNMKSWGPQLSKSLIDLSKGPAPREHSFLPVSTPLPRLRACIVPFAYCMTLLRRCTTRLPPPCRRYRQESFGGRALAIGAPIPHGARVVHTYPHIASFPLPSPKGPRQPHAGFSRTRTRFTPLHGRNAAGR